MHFFYHTETESIFISLKTRINQKKSHNFLSKAEKILFIAKTF